MKYWKYLTEEILPRWIAMTPDKECGGIFTSFDKNGSVKDTDKNIWFLGRAMWSYSVAYRLCGAKQEYLDICDHIFRFFDKCTLRGDRLPFISDREGNPKTVREIYYYSEMFAAMGCAQYYRICGRPEVWNRAERFFDTVLDLYKKNKYTTQELVDKVDGQDADMACKTFGLHMAVLATAQFMRNVKINPEKYDEVICMALDEMKNGGFVDDENRQINEYVSLSGEKLPAPLGVSSCPGHIYEAAWFVLSEGEVGNNDEIRNFGKKLVDYAMPALFENITDVIPTERDLSKPLTEDLGNAYLTWPQQEAIIAFRLAHNIFGEKKYLELSDKIEKTLLDYYNAYPEGVWFREMLKEDGKFYSPKESGTHITGPFHFERYLLALGSLQETGSILKYME